MPCLAHVLNLSAKAQLLGLKVADEAKPVLTEEVTRGDPFGFVPEMAENAIAKTVVKVSSTHTQLFLLLLFRLYFSSASLLQ